MRATAAFILASCASSPDLAADRSDRPVSPLRAESTQDPATRSAPEPRVVVEGECRASQRNDCFTSADGFRAIHPFPLATTYRDVAVLPNGEVWVVGDGATLLRISRGVGHELDLSNITVTKTPTFEDTTRSIERSNYKPGQWPGAALRKLGYVAISTNSAKDVWVAIDGGYAIHFNGISWHLEAPRGDGAGDALMRDQRGRTWMGGGTGTDRTPVIFEATGGKLVSTKGPALKSGGRVRELRRQGNQVWAAGYSGALFVSKGDEAFVAIDPPEGRREDFNGIWLDPNGAAGFLLGNNVYRKVGDRFEDKLELPGVARNIWAAPGGTSVWAVGHWAYRLEGGKFVRVPIDGYLGGDDPTLGMSEDRFEAIDGIDSTDVWMVGAYGGIFRYDGMSLKEVFPRQTHARFAGLEWAGERSWMAATGDGKLLRGTLDADSISVEASPLESVTTFVKLLSGDLILAWCGEVRVRSESGWKALPDAPSCVRKIAGTGADDFWAFGGGLFEERHVWHFKKGKWRTVSTGGTWNLYDIAVGADGTAWVGGEGVLLRSARDRLTVVARDETSRYQGFAIKSANDIWIGGASEEGFEGRVFHWNGKNLESFANAAGSSLRSIAVDAAGDIWTFGNGGVAARYDKKRFVPLATGTQQTLEHVRIHQSGIMLAAGEGGTLLRRDPKP